MEFDLQQLAIGITLLLAIWLALRLFSSSTRSDEELRRNLQARRMAQQPWDVDGAGGRANR